MIKSITEEQAKELEQRFDELRKASVEMPFKLEYLSEMKQHMLSLSANLWLAPCWKCLSKYMFAKWFLPRLYWKKRVEEALFLMESFYKNAKKINKSYKQAIKNDGKTFQNQRRDNHQQ